MTEGRAAGFWEPQMRRLWLGSAGAAVAMWSVQIAVTVEVLRNHSVAVLAVVGLIGSLPALMLLPVAGICADRYDVRRLSLIVITAQALCLGLLALFGGRNLVLLTALYAVQGGLIAFWPPARQQWLYAVVRPDQRHRANSAIGSINGLMTLVGAGLGGLLSAWHPAAATGAAAVLQLGIVGLLATLPKPAPVRKSEPAGGSGRGIRLFTDLGDGLRAARNYPLARSIVWIGIAWGLIGGGYNVLLAGHVAKDLHGGAVALAVVYVADGLSVLASTAVAGRVPANRHLPVYAIAYVAQGSFWALTFLAGDLPLTILALIVMRVASGYIIALDTTILLETVPADLRGRIASLHMTTYNAVARISLAALGGVLAIFSISVVGGVTGAASALFGAVWWWRSGRPARERYRAARETLEVS